MAFRMNNKRQISYQKFMNVLERKRLASLLLQAVARMKLHQKLSGKLLNIVFQPSFFLWFHPSHLFPVLCREINPHTKYMLQRQNPNNIARIHFNKQTWRFPKILKAKEIFFLILLSELTSVCFWQVE